MVFTQGAKRFRRRKTGAAHDRGLRWRSCCATGVQARFQVCTGRPVRAGNERYITTTKKKERKRNSNCMRAISKHNRVLLVNAMSSQKQTCKTNKATFEMRWECVTSLVTGSTGSVATRLSVLRKTQCLLTGSKEKTYF